MPEPLKNCYSEALIQSIADRAKDYYPSFATDRFVRNVLIDDWAELELMERMHRIAEVLGYYLPDNYPKAVAIVTDIASHFSGLEHMCFPDFVEQYGLEDFEVSMKALEKMTPDSTAEFAIRPFIIRFPDKTMEQMYQWANSPNEHVRRLATEGCRPRLPWAIALPEFKKNPSAVMPIIEQLIEDKILYVRRSVANNLNDISKDNPKLVVEFAQNNFGRSKNIDWVIKHACRGLLKQGDTQVLSLFGYKRADHVEIREFKADKKVGKGQQLDFEFSLASKENSLGKLRLEFVIDFMKANGKLAGKIFKIGEGEYLEKERKITKQFSFKPISTRKYYLGGHQISLVINGEKRQTLNFELVS
ncbi:MAG: DNA alkylation repair protein [Kangiellaceae bacterium]|nr:DNA alkylation repair protein [Kangiellaceae bacterium]